MITTDELEDTTYKLLMSLDNIGFLKFQQSRWSNLIYNWHYKFLVELEEDE